MTHWTGTVYLVDDHDRDHAAQVTLPGPLGLLRQQMRGLRLPSGFRLHAASAVGLTDADSPAGLSDLHPYPWRGRIAALAVDEIAFETPPRMSDRLPCPDRLSGALLPDQDETLLYLLFDAALLMPLLRLYDPADAVGDLRGAALFLSDGMAPQSPWLVDVTPDADGAPPRLLRQFLRQGWNRRAGIFLRSRAGFDEMFRFLRGFTRVRSGDDENGTILLRYWDPLVARHWFSAQRQDAQRVARLFWLPSGQPIEIIGETGATGFFRLSPAGFQPPDHRRRGMLTLTASDRQALRGVTMARLGKELSHWMMQARPDRLGQMTHRQIERLEGHVIATGEQFGLRRKEDFAALFHVMMQLGGWFHQAGATPELLDILRGGGADLGGRLTAAHADIAAQLPQGRLAAVWPQVSGQLAAIPTDQRLPPEAFRNLVARIAPPDDARLHAAVQAALRDAGALGLSPQETGVVLVLSLIYGHRYYQDPLRDWSLGPAPTRQAVMALSGRLWPVAPAS